MARTNSNRTRKQQWRKGDLEEGEEQKDRSNVNINRGMRNKMGRLEKIGSEDGQANRTGKNNIEDENKLVRVKSNGTRKNI